MKTLKALTAVAVFALFFVLSTDRPNLPVSKVGGYISPMLLVVDSITTTSASFWYYSDSSGIEWPEGTPFKQKLAAVPMIKGSWVKVVLFYPPEQTRAPSKIKKDHHGQ